jgi:hypothetical protein
LLSILLMEKKCSYVKDKWIEPPTHKLLNVPIVQAGWGSGLIMPSLNKPTTVLGGEGISSTQTLSMQTKLQPSSALCPTQVEGSPEKSLCWFMDCRGRIEFPHGALALWKGQCPNPWKLQRWGIGERFWVGVTFSSCLLLISRFFNRKTVCSLSPHSSFGSLYDFLRSGISSTITHFFSLSSVEFWENHQFCCQEGEVLSYRILIIEDVPRVVH